MYLVPWSHAFSVLSISFSLSLALFFFFCFQFSFSVVIFPLCKHLAERFTYCSTLCTYSRFRQNSAIQIVICAVCNNVSRKSISLHDDFNVSSPSGKTDDGHTKISQTIAANKQYTKRFIFNTEHCYHTLHRMTDAEFNSSSTQVV